MNKTVTTVAVVAVAGAAGFYLLRNTSKSEKRSETEGTAAMVDAKERTSTERPSTGGQGGPGIPPKPLRYAGDPESGGPSQINSSYTRNDGTQVRDHRANPPEPDLDRVNAPPKEISKVQPITLAAVRKAIRPAMKGCIETYRQGDGAGQKAQARLLISITDEVLHVDEVKVTTTDVEDHDGFVTCITDKVLGHEQLVEGSVDVKAHPMIFPYDLNRPY